MASRTSLVLVGVGLIGGSVGAGLRQSGFSGELVGVGRSAGNLERALAAGLVDRTSADLCSAVADADMVLVAAPVATSLALLRELAPALPGQAVISDVGSVKAPICSLAEELGLGERFVGGHPLAGGTGSGAAAARADLFEGAAVVLCPGQARAGARERVARMWRSLGAEVTEMDAGEHDRVLSLTSHVPQLLASALALAVGRRGAETAGLAGPALDDMTRLAASEPEMWAQICRANQAEIGSALKDLSVALDEFALALDGTGEERLDELFRLAAAARRAIGKG